MPTLEDFKSGYAASKKLVYNLRLFCDEEFSKIYRIYQGDIKDSEVDKAAEAEFKKVNSTWGRHGEYSLVGLEEATSPWCGTHARFDLGCLNTKGHANTLAGNFKDKIYLHVVTRSCDKPSCKICMRYGWAVREAYKAEKRLKFASAKFGKIEHVMLSPPVSDYVLGYDKLHAKALKIAFNRGVIGGCIIFHAFRYGVGFREWETPDTSNSSLKWFFAPHWHIIGFLKESYNRCRNCPDFAQWYSHGGVTSGCHRDCHCDGFEQKTRLQNETDGYICKVGGERKTVGGTIWYQLTHSSIRAGKKRFYPLTWFGVAGYHKLHYKAEKVKLVCPLCGLPLVPIRQCGCNGVKICTDMNDPNFHRNLWLDMYDKYGANLFVKASDGDLG
jgi:hypothetical protein